MQDAHKIKTALHLDNHKRKGDGKSQFKLRVYFREKKYIFIRTGKFMDAKYWVDRKIKSSKDNPDASDLKTYLSGLVSRCEKVVNGLIEAGKTVTRKAVEKALFAPPPAKAKYGTYFSTLTLWSKKIAKICVSIH